MSVVQTELEEWVETSVSSSIDLSALMSATVSELRKSEYA